MANIVTRAGKGSPLTNAEMDANFEELIVSLKYRGTFSAISGFPSTPSQGDLYVNTVEGTISTVLYKVDDVVFYDGATWKKAGSSGGGSGVGDMLYLFNNFI